AATTAPRCSFGLHAARAQPRTAFTRSLCEAPAYDTGSSPAGGGGLLGEQGQSAVALVTAAPTLVDDTAGVAHDPVALLGARGGDDVDRGSRGEPDERAGGPDPS